MTKIIAVDFDGTLCKNAYPKIGEPNNAAINRLKAEQADGAKVILWTCREGKSLSDAVAFCGVHGIRLDAVNDNLEERKRLFENNPRKVGATEYWDDKAVSVKA